MTKQSLHLFAGQPGASEKGAVLKVVVLYDDLPAGKRAMQALHESASAFQFQPQLWRLDLLEDRSWREYATPEVIHADMVFISVTSDDLPAWLRDWLRACLLRMHGRRGALVAVSGAGINSDDRVVRELLWLEEGAREAGWDFFSSKMHENGSAGNDAQAHELPATGSRLLRFEGVAEVFGQIPYAELHAAPYRHWGINE